MKHKFTSEEAKKAGQKSRKNKHQITVDVQNAFKKLLEDNVSNMEEWLKQVAKDNPLQALKIMSDLAEFVIPKKARSENINYNINQDVDIDLPKELLDRFKK